MAKAIVSQHIILCRDKKLSKLQEQEKKNLSRPKSFLSRQKISKDLKKSCCDRENSVAIELPGPKTIVCRNKGNYVATN